MSFIIRYFQSLHFFYIHRTYVSYRIVATKFFSFNIVRSSGILNVFRILYKNIIEKELFKEFVNDCKYILRQYDRQNTFQYNSTVIAEKFFSNDISILTNLFFMFVYLTNASGQLF